MNRRTRTSESQEHLNAMMRRTGVREYLAHQAMHATPASPAVVKRFLATAPEEIFVLLDGLLPPPEPIGFSRGSVHDNPLVRGLVGFILSTALRPHVPRSNRPDGGDATVP